MKNSENKTELYLFLNVFDVTPTFLLPVFTDRTRFFFQEIENDAIKSFSEADLDYFSDCPQIKPISNDVYSVGESAIYAVQFPDGRLISGNSRTLLAHLNEEKALIDRFPVFKENVQEFQKQINKNETLTISSLQPIAGIENREKCLNELIENTIKLNKIVKEVYTHSDFFPLLLFENSKKQSKLSDSGFSVLQPQVVNDFDLVPYTSNIISKNSNFIFKNEVFEDRSYAIYCQSENVIVANTIFQFYDFIMTRGISTSGINPVIKYKKGNFTSVKQQLKVIDILLNCTPVSHKKIFRYIRSSHKFYGKQLYERLNKMQGRLWTYDYLLTLFSLSGFSISWRSLQSLIHDWKLCINIPEQITSDDDASLSISEWLYDYLEAQNDDDDDNTSKESRVFWLEIKQLSSNIYTIIAQNNTTKDAFFWLIREPISDIILSSFIEGLYNDIGAKVYLLLTNSTCNRTPLNENFDKWLLKNENICHLIENPTTLTVRE